MRGHCDAERAGSIRVHLDHGSVLHFDRRSALGCVRVHWDAFQFTGIMGVHWDA